MKRLWAAIALGMLVLVTANAGAQVAPGKEAVLAKMRTRIEATDFRATGRLVKIGGDGKRTSYKVSMKGHWFPDGLRVMFQVTDPANSRMTALLHMTANGHATIEVAKGDTTTGTALPFEKWSDGLVGTDFSYEDILEMQYFWKGQEMLAPGKCGARDCVSLKSVPGTDDRSHYTSVVSSIDTNIFFPVLVVKTVKGTDARKEFSSEGLRQNSGVWSASQVEVKVTGQPGSSLLIIERGSAKAKLALKDFDFKAPPMHGEE